MFRPVPVVVLPLPVGLGSCDLWVGSAGFKPGAYGPRNFKPTINGTCRKVLIYGLTEASCTAQPA